MDKLKSLRVAKKMTLQELGNLVGLRANTICQYEKGNRKPSYIILQKFAKVFNCKIDDLVD